MRMRDVTRPFTLLTLITALISVDWVQETVVTSFILIGSFKELSWFSNNYLNVKMMTE